MPKGHKRIKGVPELHDELKGRVNFSLTPKAVEGLDALAAERGLSRSELIERIGRKRVLLREPSTLEPEEINLEEFDPSVLALIEKAVEDMPPLKALDPSKVQMTRFAERASLPNSPGAFVVSNWFRNHYETDTDLKFRFQNETFNKHIATFFEGSLDNVFILWIACDIRFLNAAWSVVRATFDRIQEEVISRSLSKEGLQYEKGIYSKPENTN